MESKDQPPKILDQVRNVMRVMVPSIFLTRWTGSIQTPPGNGPGNIFFLRGTSRPIP